MAKFRQVYTEFWNDPNVVEEMTPEDKYFMLYLLTNDKTTQIGVYQITKKQIAFDMGYSPESIESLVDRFSKKHDRIIYNKETREVAIKNWGKYNFFRGGKPFIDLIKSEIEKVKDPRLVKYVFEHYIKCHETNKEVVELLAEYLERKKMFDESYHDTLTSRTTTGGQEEEKEEEEEKELYKDKEREKKKKKTARFTPPPLDEIKAYCLERENKIDPEQFRDFYESKNWMVGKNKMKDWKAAIRNWERRDKESKPKQADKKFKTKFHLSDSRTSKYTAEELEARILKRQGLK